MLLALWLAVAEGHDFATRTAAHRLEMQVDLDAIRVDYTVEAPFGTGSDPMRPGPDVQTPDEVAAGLLLLVDGQTVAMRLEEKPRVRATSHTATIRLRLVADAPAGEATIVVSNGNYPDLAGQFWTEAWLDAQVDVLSTDLIAGGSDLTARWRGDEAARTTTLHVRPRRGAIEQAWARLGGTEGLLRPLSAAAPATARSFWTDATLRPVDFAGLSVVAVALSSLVQIGAPQGPGRRRLVLGIVAAAFPGLVLPWVAVGPYVGAVALALAGWAAWKGPALPAVLAGLCALAATTGRPGYAALMAVVVAAAMVGLPKVPPEGADARPGRLVVGLAALAGTIALARGLL